MPPTVLLTGATSGIGLEAARQLLSSGAQLILGVRDPEKAGKLSFGDALEEWQLTVFPLDLESLPSIRKLVKLVEQKFEGVDAIVNNAAALYPDGRLTANDICAQMQTIYLGPFLLTELLRPRLRPRGRIVNVVSDRHKAVPRFDTSLLEARDFVFMRSYAEATMAKVIWTYELARRLSQGQVAHCVYPGECKTGLYRNVGGLMFKLRSMMAGPAAEGGRRVAFLVTDPSALASNGKYWVNGAHEKTSPVSYDAETAKKLWYWSARHVSDF